MLRRPERIARTELAAGNRSARLPVTRRGGVLRTAAPAFTRHLAGYLDDAAFRALQLFLVDQPETGDLMPSTGGFRKLRWGDERRGKGKRGGLRVIYYFLREDHQIWLFTLYGKDEADDLTPAQKAQLRAAIEAEREMRRTARLRRRRR